MASSGRNGSLIDTQMMGRLGRGMGVVRYGKWVNLLYIRHQFWNKTKWVCLAFRKGAA